MDYIGQINDVETDVLDKHRPFQMYTKLPRKIANRWLSSTAVEALTNKMVEQIEIRS